MRIVLNLMKKPEYEIIDNFFEKDHFEKLKEIAMSEEMPWYWGEVTWRYVGDPEPVHRYFQHTLYNQAFVYSQFYEEFSIGFWEKLKMKALMRMKLNLYPQTQTIEVHNRHIDYIYDHKGCLFSFNTCDGFTTLEDGTKIESVANRALLFNPSKFHSSCSTTNDKARLNMNINYFYYKP